MSYDTHSMHTIKRTMRQLISADADETYTDNATTLVEDTADKMGHLEWLDDHEHAIWDCAVDVLTDLEQQNRG